MVKQAIFVILDMSQLTLDFFTCRLMNGYLVKNFTVRRHPTNARHIIVQQNRPISYELSLEMKELEKELVDVKISHVVIKSKEHDFTKSLVSKTQLCLPFTVHVYFHDADDENSYDGTLELFIHDKEGNKYYRVSVAHTLICDEQKRMHSESAADAEQYEENIREANKAVDKYDFYTGWSLHANSYGTILHST